MVLIIINNNKILFSLFVTLQLNGSRWLFSRTLGAASPPRVHFPLAWLFLYGLAPFHTYHRHYRDRLRNRLVPFAAQRARSRVHSGCAFLDFTSSTWIARTSDWDGEEEEEVERKAEGIFLFRVCSFFFLYFLVCFLFFFRVFFCVRRELGWSKRWRRITSLSIHPQSLACNVALQPELEFQYFLRSDFFSSRGWRFCDFFAGKGEKWGTRREKISSLLGPPEVRS
jgi:hypothetical protein